VHPRASLRANDPRGNLAPSRSPLGAPHRLREHPAVPALERRLWGGPLGALSVGLPRHLAAGNLEAFLRSDDVLLDLVRVPEDGARRACLLVPRTCAAQVVDHLLGGDGQIAQTLSLREAECGVLAYALARTCAELALPFQVSGVNAREPRLSPRFSDGVIWPFLLETPLGPLDLRLVLSAAEVSGWTESVPVTLLLTERMEQDRSALQPGDVLLSDAWSLTVTAQGLEGGVLLALPGSAQLLKAQLTGGQLCVVGAVSEALGPDRLELALGTFQLGFSELVALIAGEPHSVPNLPADPVYLSCAGSAFAEGSLVVHRGALGVRLHSMR
jgi:hypothetical protein